ncbi:MAG: FAD-dependent oxidoreductase, partial [Burkholderiaceae bacterium]
GFEFKPGQAIDLVLAGPGDADAQDGRHAFSLVSAPFESSLTVATRLRDSAFKRALQALRPGARARLEGPFGSLTLHRNPSRPGVLIAGGIGITPFMSMLRQAAHDGMPQQLRLLYSNRRPETTAFLEELQQIERQHERFRLVATMTQADPPLAGWSGQTGSIDETLLKRHTEDLNGAIWYLVGSPDMVAAMRQTLGRIGVDEDDVRGEEFFGY